MLKGRTTETVVRRCSLKKVFLEILQNSQCLRSATLLKTLLIYKTLNLFQTSYNILTQKTISCLKSIVDFCLLGSDT